MMRSDDYLQQHPEDYPLYDDLLEIVDLASVPSWLADHTDFARRVLIQAQPVLPLYTLTAKALLEVLVVVMQDDVHATWFREVAHAGTAVPLPADNLFQHFFRSALLGLSELVGAQATITTAAPAEVQKLLEAYIQLVGACTYNPNLLIPDALSTEINQTATVAREQGMNDLFAKLSRQLAHYYIQQGETIYAVHFARQALSEYGWAEDSAGIADAHSTLAIAYREESDLNKRSDAHLQLARQHAQPDHLTGRDYNLLYEEGVRAYIADLYDLALSYLNDALAGFELLKAPHHIAMTNTMLAMTYVYMKRFADAEATIAVARKGWDALENEFELANLRFVDADLELHRGNLALGLNLLDEAQHMAENLQPSESCTQLIARIEQHRERYGKR